MNRRVAQTQKKILESCDRIEKSLQLLLEERQKDRAEIESLRSDLFAIDERLSLCEGAPVPLLPAVINMDGLLVYGDEEIATGTQGDKSND